MSTSDSSQSREAIFNHLCSVFEEINGDSPPDELKITLVSGGITNILYRAQWPAHKLDVLIRFFGADTDLVIDRQIERRIIKALNDLQFGPRIYGEFEGGRIEAFLNGHCPQPTDMNNNSQLQSLIAEKLREMHGLTIPDNIIDKQPILFSTLRKWLKAAQAVDFTSDAKKAAIYTTLALDQVSIQFDRLEKQVNELNAQVVFAHNDLLSGNILYDEKKAQSSSSVTFIDFEYGGYNYACFDIANHFCECCGYDCDFTALFPTIEQQRTFIASYLQVADPSSIMVTELLREIHVFIPLSHAFWGLWAVVQASVSSIDFDFIGYAEKRLNAFQKTWPDDA